MLTILARIFLHVLVRFTKPPTVIFRKVELFFNFYNFFFLFYPPTLNIIRFVEKKMFLRFCLCIFESDTVKSDCPMQIFRKIMKYFIPTVGLFH